MKHNFEQYQNLLKYKGRDRDKATFEKWASGEININQCYDEFMKNNGYKYISQSSDYNTPYYVFKKDFVHWLNSMGYYRDKKDKEIYLNGKTKGEDIDKD